MIFAILTRPWLGYAVEIRAPRSDTSAMPPLLLATSLASARALVPRGYHGIRRDPPGADGLLELWAPSAPYLAAARTA